MLDACPGTMIGIRDQALISLGFAGAFRRSELVALRINDLTE
jgi:integrase